MSLNISTLARNAIGDAAVDLIDEGTSSASGYVEIRTGTKPSSPQVAATGTLLATLFFSNPAFDDFVNGQADADTITEDSNINANGVAGWFRIYDRDGNALYDGDVTVSGGDGDLEFDTVNFVSGGTAAITAWRMVVPATAEC
jgi:hypothetical protein